MLRAKRPVLASTLAATLILSSVLPSAAMAKVEVIGERPGEIAMIGDLIFARPTLIVSTVVGVGIWAVSLPFSLLGGNTGEAGQTLVVAPAKSAFIRCLGCTPAQHESLATERRADKREKEMAQQ